MNVLHCSTRKRLVCPTTGYQVYTKELAVYPFCDGTCTGTGMAVVWWHCGCCDDWHLLLMTPVPIPAQPLLLRSLN